MSEKVVKMATISNRHSQAINFDSDPVYYCLALDKLFVWNKYNKDEGISLYNREVDVDKQSHNFIYYHEGCRYYRFKHIKKVLIFN